MDGLLIDSEPLWRRAEVEVFGALGVPLTEELCHQTTGLRMDAVVRYWQRRFPSVRLPAKATSDAVCDAFIALIEAEGSALPGAVQAVHRLASWGLADPPLPRHRRLAERPRRRQGRPHGRCRRARSRPPGRAPLGARTCCTQRIAAKSLAALPPASS